MLREVLTAFSRTPGKKYLEAQDTLTKACKLQPSATTWLGLAICYFYQAQNVMANQAKLVDVAEEALQVIADFQC